MKRKNQEARYTNLYIYKHVTYVYVKLESTKTQNWSQLFSFHAKYENNFATPSDRSNKRKYFIINL